MMAGMVLTNLLYVVGAIVAATLVSLLVLLRHRRPRSLESSIEMFSRELKALQPERLGTRPTILKTSTQGPTAAAGAPAGPAGGPAAPSQRAHAPAASPADSTERPARGRSRTSAGVAAAPAPDGGRQPGISTPPIAGARSVVRLATALPPDDDGSSEYSPPGRDGAGPPSPDQESEPG
jgi:hypothetical protein